jgi:hypothetical protein
MTGVALFSHVEVDRDRQYKSVLIKSAGKKIGLYRYRNHKQRSKKRTTLTDSAPIQITNYRFFWEKVNGLLSRSPSASYTIEPGLLPPMVVLVFFTHSLAAIVLSSCHLFSKKYFV